MQPFLAQGQALWTRDAGDARVPEVAEVRGVAHPDVGHKVVDPGHVEELGHLRLGQRMGPRQRNRSRLR